MKRHLRNLEHWRIIVSVVSLPMLLALAGCGSGGSDGGDGAAAVPTRGFQIQSPEIDISPGQEITHCYYFRTPNTEMFAIKRWQSSMSAGVHGMTLLMTTNDLMPPGTVSAANCGNTSNALPPPAWTYAADLLQLHLLL